MSFLFHPFGLGREPVYHAQLIAEESALEVPVVVKLAPSHDSFGEWNQWLRLTLENLTGGIVIVHWDRLAFVDSQGRSHTVGRYSWHEERNAKSTTYDIVPERDDPVTLLSRGAVWAAERVCPIDQVKKRKDVVPGCVGWLLEETSISLVLALEVEGREVSQTYRFKIRVTRK